MSTASEADELSAAISVLEAQRPILGDAVVDAALGPMRARLAALTTAEPQRKMATILFADVSGFTALTESMDAELMATIMNDLWALVDLAIIDHGGRIDKHIGDAVMALWGAETAREDDPEQAIRAALAMQTAVGAFCQTHSLPFALRIGLCTGPVVIGQMGTRGELTAMGDAVNLASRLEHAAPVGGVLISHDTYRHVRGIFDVEVRPPLTVKGKVEPVQTYVVQRAKPRAFRLHTRGVEGVETHMIGRDHELGMLQEAFFDVIDEGQTRLMIIIGEAGVGKSRLLYEFDNWLELRPERVVYFKGRSTPILQSIPNSLFRDLFAFRFNVRDGDSMAEALAHFRSGFISSGRPGVEGETGVTLTAEQADIVGHWLGFDFSSSPAVDKLLGSPEFRTIAQAYFLRYFRNLTAAQPVVIFLEDIHWADNGSLDLISHLMQSIPDAQLLVVGVARSSLYDRRAHWAEGEAATSRIDLHPLSRRGSRALVDEILREVDDVPQSFHALIVESAEGNPFYTEELVKMFIEQGVIVRGADTERWQVQADKLADVQVPPTLIGLLQARLDSLPEPERELLQRAAVVGRLFWDGVVAELGHTERTNIQPVLEAIRRRELIFQREQSAFAGNDEFVFKHSLLRDVAYERVLLKWRQELHVRVARWLEAQAGERLGEYLGQIAEHYQLAGQNDQAAAYLLRAGNMALRVGNFAAARQSYEHVLALSQGEGEAAGGTADSLTSVEAAVRLGETYHGLGDLQRAERTSASGLAGARQTSNRQLEAEALWTMCRIFIDRGDLRECSRVMKEMLPKAQAVGGRTLVRATLVLCALQWALGDLAASESSAEVALTLARGTSDNMLEGRALNMRAIVASQLGNHELARQLHEEALAIALTNGNLVSEATAYLSLGVSHYRDGDYSAARSFGLAASRQLHEIGDTLGEVIVLINLAQADLQLGDRDAARRQIREALRMAKEQAALLYFPGTVMVTAEIMAAEGERARALAWLWLAHEDPKADFPTVKEIEGLFEKWAVDEDEMVAAKAAAVELDLDTVVAEILAGEL